jgi:hypothetical protein
MLSIAACFGYIEEQDDPTSWEADHYIDSAQSLMAMLTGKD